MKTVIILFIYCFFVFNIFAKTNYSFELPELITKQAINNLRYLSKDGSYTYFQKQNGTLILATNYKVFELLKSSKGTNYNIYSNTSSDILLIEKREQFHSYIGIRIPSEIYYTKRGSQNIEFLGKGSIPKIHSSGKWASFYNYYLKTLTIINIKNRQKNFTIKLFNKFSPYFIPQIIITPTTILYTDINENGIEGLLLHKPKSIPKLILKAIGPLQKIELCYSSSKLYIGTFSYEGTNNKSSIQSLDIQNPDAKEILYSSDSNDIGHMICNYDNNIYFIKNTNKRKQLFDIAALNVKKKTIKIITKYGDINQIINMDGNLLIPRRGTFYVLKGINDLKTDTFKQNKYQ